MTLPRDLWKDEAKVTPLYMFIDSVVVRHRFIIVQTKSSIWCFYMCNQPKVHHFMDSVVVRQRLDGLDLVLKV